jgi:hypothetical protein
VHIIGGANCPQSIEDKTKRREEKSVCILHL